MSSTNDGHANRAFNKDDRESITRFDNEWLVTSKTPRFQVSAPIWKWDQTGES